MTTTELLHRCFRASEGLDADDCVRVLIRLHQPLAVPIKEDVLRHQIWYALTEAQSDPERLVTVANALWAVAIGWSGAPLLDVAEVDP